MLLSKFGPSSAVKVERTVTVDRPAEELYRFWRNLENLPRIMDHLKSVKMLDDRRSHWVAKGPIGMKIEWNSELTEDIESEKLAWKSIKGSEIDNSGSILFLPAPGGRGTEVKVTLCYTPPGGRLGLAFAKLLGEEPSIQVRDALHEFKQLMEAGEIASTEGQSRCH